MANSKISALTSATTPLAGTETLPVVQSGVTKQVSVANLTAGRSISASGITVTGLTASKPVFTDASSNLTSSGTVPTNQGGTGLTSFTQFGVFYASDTATVAQTNNLKWQSSSLAINAGANAPGYNLEVVGSARWTDTFAQNGYEISPGSTNIITSYNRTTGTWLTLRQRANTHEFYVAGALAWTMDVNNNIVPATAAKGINFTANTPAAGMTSRLLNWYEEGTWTPTATSTGGAITSYTSVGNYVRVGKQVTLTARISITNGGTGSGAVTVGGFPFANNSNSLAAVAGREGASGKGIIGSVGCGASSAYTTFYDATYWGSTNYEAYFTITYITS